MKYRTEREFILSQIEYESGLINAWKHIVRLANNCIKAHKESATFKYQKSIAKMNPQLFVKPLKPRRKKGK